MKHQAYHDRAMRARDPRFAQIFGKLGYDTTSLAAAAPAPAPAPVDITALRAEYESLTGKKPYMGWDAPTLSAKIAEKRASA